MFPVTQDRRRKTVGSGCEDHGQQSRLLFSKRSIPAAVPLLPPPDPAGCRNRKKRKHIDTVSDNTYNQYGDTMSIPAGIIRV